MTAQEILAEIRMLGGRLEARGDRLHVDVPAGTLGQTHRDALSAFKHELLALIQTKDAEMEASMRRPEAADISVAVFDDGSMRVIQSDAATQQAKADGGTVYTPEDMYHYVRLKPHERRMLHAFKRTFGGSTEWKKR